jgi:hypothetical protein
MDSLEAFGLRRLLRLLGRDSVARAGEQRNDDAEGEAFDRTIPELH